MDNADERRSKAREILFSAADYLIKKDDSLWKFSLADGAHVVIFYEGAHRDGSGEFSCRYNLLPAVEKMLAEMEKRVDDLTFNAPRKDGMGMATTALSEYVNKQDRQEATFFAVRFATILLIGHFAQKFAGVMPEAVDDALLIAEAGLHSTIAKSQDDAALAYVKTDLQPAIKQRGDESAAQRVAELTALLRTWSHVQLETSRGRRPEITKARVFAAISNCKAGGVALAPKTIASLLDCSATALQNWARGEGYQSAQQALNTLSDETTNYPLN